LVDSAAALDGLNQAQLAAVTSRATPLCVLAGAGSGKTRVLTRRVAYRIAIGSADPRHVLALTFTRKAAGELTSRLAALGIRPQVPAGTFHALAYAQLRRWWTDQDRRPPALLERKARVLVPLMGRRRDSTVQPADVAAEIEWAKARLVAPSEYERSAAEAGRRPPLPAPVMAGLYDRYEQEKHRRGLVDFDDLLLECARAIENDPAFGAAQRWCFRHLFVDEFQDVNPLQFRLLEAWRGDRDDLFVVGDPNQAIYSWNGADTGYLTQFRSRFPEAEVVRLDDNYRSTPQVLTVADAVLGGAKRTTRPLVPHRSAGAIPRLRAFPTDKEEAIAVARAVRDHHGPHCPWSHIAVLMRTNAQSVLFEAAFRAVGIPYRVRGAGSLLDQPEVRQALSAMRAGAAHVPFTSRLDDLELMLDDAGGTDERRMAIEALVRLGREYATALGADTGRGAASVEGFLAWLSGTVRGDEPDAGADAVEIATFHRSKGLEWPVVFLTGLERGLVPIGHADHPEAQAEERRLLYVACTRAQAELHLSWAERRTFGSRSLSRTRSPYLDAVEVACRALSAGAGPGDWRRFLEEGRTQLKGAGPKPRRNLGRVEVGAHADPSVLAALKAWRLRAAKASGVPAFVILHDTTLAAVAEARPADRAGLLALPGMGPVKAERYGDALLALVREHRASA
jgi:DNA helicase-2/ATP-dependent DNA helicase PcrA